MKRCSVPLSVNSKVRGSTWSPVHGMDLKRSPRDLQGVRAAVLGSMSGIGRAVALALAEAGADVIVHGRSSQPEAAEVAAAVRAAGGRSHVLMADLSDRRAGDRLLA